MTTLLRHHGLSRNVYGIVATLRRSAAVRPVPASIPWQPMTALRQRTSEASRKPQYKYPELLSVYVQPTSAGIWVAFRLATMAVSVLSWTVGAPLYLMNPATPAWFVPTFLFVTSGPFLFCAAFGQIVLNIKASLPPAARRTTEDLRAFLAKIPPASRMRITYVRFAPWPLKREVFVSDLRRLPISRVRLVNMQIVGDEAGGAKTIMDGWFGWYRRSFWVNMGYMSRDNSAVPGMWEHVWRQLPVLGEEVAQKPMVEALPKRPLKAKQLVPPPSGSRRTS
ncbi:hypothetical protein BAUCODRAFT_124319 [Baudoinia panamericana UAMH 10762]|uniref:Uncharacterized protein n=1 Tax=Baudoinia panamericana (strain UAMH 10762) TaxID=717646 RepID=M2N7E0_BAUPA|nr:uncharacterized protein BAUCODRAFT_124319 [Baudoinia panamericana UAMH 10762]EMC94720.1 hypothetical protein BAUCODRAFT_124319 [Baudoinia panamericana UAMH 10762]